MDWFREQGLLDGILDENHTYREFELESDLIDAVFGEDGHREAVDAFVEARRDVLSHDDLDVAPDWKHAIAGEYYAVRRGSDVYFLEGAHAYAVRGITHELDDRFLDLPMHVFTYLVPFHTCDTYLTVMRQLSTHLPKREEASLLDRIVEAERDGHLIRTGEEFRNMSENADNDVRRDLIPEALRNLASVHVGVLAGLSWDEREAEIVRHKEQSVDREAVLASIDEFRLSGEPTHAYREIIRRVDTDLLESFVRAHDVYDNLTKQECVDLLADIYEPRLPKVTDDLRKLGIQFVRDVRDLCEHAGELRIPKDAIKRQEDVPYPVFPHVEYFDNGTEYVVVLSDEMRAVCEDVDWETEVARAERLEEALAFLDVAVDYRGIIARNEALHEVVRRFGDVDVAELEDAVERRSVNGLLHTFPVTLGSGKYFAAANLVNERDEIKVDKARSILAQRRGMSAVWPTSEQVAQGRLVDAWSSYEAGRRLAAYLDEHVLGIADDYSYAENTMAVLVGMTQRRSGALIDLEAAVMLLGGGDAQRDEVMPLLRDLYYALPNRYHNGSVPHRSRGQDVAPRKTKKKRPTKKAKKRRR